MKIKIRTKNIFILCTIFAFFPPEIIERFSSSFDSVMRYLQILFLLLFIFLIFKKRSIRITRSHILWGVFCLYGLGLTILFQPQFTYAYLIKVAVPIFYAVIVCMYFRMETNGLDHLVACMSKYWVALLVINALLMLFFPKGVIRNSIGATHERANWLFGSKNNIVFPMLFAAVFLLLNYQRAKGKKRLACFFALVLMFFELSCSGAEGVEFLGGSSTGLVAFLFILVLFWGRRIVHKINLDNHLSVGITALLFLVLNALVLYGAIGSGSIISTAFGLFGKDVTASGRTNVWIIVLSQISQAPLFGHGYIMTNFTRTLTSCYNFFLDIILRYGMVGLALLFCVFFSYQNKKNNKKSNTDAYIFWSCIAGMLLCGIVNTIAWQYLVVLMELFDYVQGEKGSIDRGEKNAR